MTKQDTRCQVALLLAVLTLTGFTCEPVSTAAAPQAVWPNPVLVFLGQESYETGGKQWIRYRYAVDNYAAYPDEMFAIAPDLPPCGENTNASRTWVDIYDQSGTRLYGFCALRASEGLNRLWFAVEQDVVPPRRVYIELHDRRTHTRYVSNLAETTM